MEYYHSQGTQMKEKRAICLLGSIALVIFLPFFPSANAETPSSKTSSVLRQEARWLKAICDGDRATVDSILAKTYKHIDDKGYVIDRAHELSSLTKQALTMTPTEQTVDFAGDVAIVRGLNTVILEKKLLVRDRFTDVFINRNGRWLALSAQETVSYKDTVTYK
jgi:hypothetical protein